MILQRDPSADMERIFRRDEFDRSPGWWDRFTSAVGDFFGKLSFSWLGPVGQFLLWLLLVVAVVALITFLWRRFRSRTPRVKEERPDEIVPIEIDAVTDPAALHDAVAGFEQERDYKQAILFRYRELVATLMRHGLVSTRPGRTTGELRVDLAESAPAAHRAFDVASTLFEVAWFSDHPSTREEYERLDHEAAETTRLSGQSAPSPVGEP